MSPSGSLRALAVHNLPKKACPTFQFGQLYKLLEVVSSKELRVSGISSMPALRLLTAAALVGAASAFAPPLSVRPQSAMRAAVVMADEKKAAPKKEKAPPKPRLPGEGDPFGAAALAYSEVNKDGLSAYQPRGISDATVIDVYQNCIESDDEPWHATCRSSNVLGVSSLTYASRPPVLELWAWCSGAGLTPPCWIALALAGRRTLPMSPRFTRRRRSLVRRRLAAPPLAGRANASSPRRTTTRFRRAGEARRSTVGARVL